MTAVNVLDVVAVLVLTAAVLVAFVLIVIGVVDRTMDRESDE